MDPFESSTPPRSLTAAEIGGCIRQFRELRRWSQEQLAEISGLNVRTIQRVEQGESASFDTRRAFAFEDIDVFNKPFSIPTPDELKVAQETFERENITLAIAPLTSGRQLAGLVETCEMDLSEPAFELPRDAAETFAALVDAFREYRDCVDLHTEVQKLEVFEAFQHQIDTLRALGVSLCHAQRKFQVGASATDRPPLLMTALYVVAFPAGKEPSHIATPKAARIG